MGVGGGREGGFGGEGRRGVGEIKKLEHGSRSSINLVLSSPYKSLLNIENLHPNASYASHPIPEPKNIDVYLSVTSTPTPSPFATENHTEI